MTFAAHTRCRNCATAFDAAPGNFCRQCGQATRLHLPTVWEFVHEFANHYVALEGKLWRTLGLLFAKPGVLTREYLEGRRERYVLPLRLFLTFSIVFFIAFRLTLAPPPPGVAAPAPAIAAAQQAAAPAQAADNEKFRSTMKRATLQNGPYVAFFLLPFFALLLRVAYGSRDLNFGSHLVFAFHFHAVLFGVILAGVLLPYRVLQASLFAVTLIYLGIALHNAYGGRWWVTAMRAGFVMLAHSLALFMTTALLSKPA